jgi:hypothetical protein
MAVRTWNLGKKSRSEEVRRMKASSKPWLWRPLWSFCIASIVVMAIIQYFYLAFPVVTVLEGVVLVSVLLGISYYIRIRTSLAVNRAVYILLGITPIGFCLMLVLGFSVGRVTLAYLGPWPSFIIIFLVPYAIGAFIGDWIGRKRNYQLPFSP